MRKRKLFLREALLVSVIMSQLCTPAFATTIPEGYSDVEIQRRQMAYGAYTESAPEVYSTPYNSLYYHELTPESVAIIDGFAAEHIKSGMNDFQKEMEIIKWLADRVHEDKEYTKDSPAYENTYIYPIELGFGTYGGYVDAFKILAMASGLDVKIVGGYAPSDTGHLHRRPWNLICLDGAWYNVNLYKADRDDQQDLDLRWINLTDEEMAKNYIISSPDVPSCTETKYGIGATEEYCKQRGWPYIIADDQAANNEVNTSSDDQKQFEERLQAEQAIFDDESYKAFYYSSVNQTSGEIIDYISSCIENKEENISFKIFYPESMNNVKIFQSEGSNVGIATQISNKVASAIDSKYKGNAFKSSVGQLSQTRVYEAKNGYWMTYLSQKLPHYKKKWKA